MTGFVFSSKGEEYIMLAEAKRLSLFNTLEALDLTVNKFKMIADQYLRRGKKNFLAVVELLRRYSCKTKGVSFCKVATMAKILELSERTIQRIINRLVELGIVKKRMVFDQKTGAQLPNYYQLQDQIDWKKVVDSLSPQIVVAHEGELVEPSALADTQDDTRNVTPPVLDKPNQHKPFWAIPDKGSFLYAVKSLKKDNKYNQPTSSFSFYNWLEPEEDTFSPEKKISSQQYLDFISR